MQRVGAVVNTAQGLAVVRASDASYPDLGTSVIDERLDTVGEVVDVFGPVDRPFVAVSPASETQLAPLLGTVVYARSDG
ncbi:H/ACA ribonucleoprotein complex subunit GAR1 [Halocatena pleomorpha]|uniref:H/ACA RNA-protein complex component Gar1 n=1 Tax=Halocatena pleomorpha TaxID=1785090 RepID=A0A3P3RC83_9EURY|nr:Gar1/Naf1 family protein [Halocatena pleomorpha]RRJ30579.1 H/ACA RNA-protein complex component Gar1 [Halocatena pleomorpha]